MLDELIVILFIYFFLFYKILFYKNRIEIKQRHKENREQKYIHV